MGKTWRQRTGYFPSRTIKEPLIERLYTFQYSHELNDVEMSKLLHISRVRWNILKNGHCRFGRKLYLNAREIIGDEVDRYVTPEQYAKFAF